MKRPRRLILPALLIALLLALAGLWVRSYFIADTYTWERDRRSRFGVATSPGGMILLRVTAPPSISLSFDQPPGYHRAPPTDPTYDFKPQWNFLGFNYAPADFFGIAFVAIRIPFWPFALLLGLSLAALPLIHRRRTRRRLRAGLCPICAYDLRATPDRCPECGHSPPPPRSEFDVQSADPPA